MISIGENLQLSVSLSNFSTFHQLILSDGFDCILFVFVCFIRKLRQIHPSKGTLTNDISDEEVSQLSVRQIICFRLQCGLILSTKKGE